MAAHYQQWHLFEKDFCEFILSPAKTSLSLCEDWEVALMIQKHIHFSLRWDLTVVFSLKRHPDLWPTASKHSNVAVRDVFVADHSSSQVTSSVLPREFSSLILLSLLVNKVENNGPGCLFNDKTHSFVCLPEGYWFGYSSHHASAHCTSSFHLHGTDQCEIRRQATSSAAWPCVSVSEGFLRILGL